MSEDSNSMDIVRRARQVPASAIVEQIMAMGEGARAYREDIDRRQSELRAGSPATMFADYLRANHGITLNEFDRWPREARNEVFVAYAFRFPVSRHPRETDPRQMETPEQSKAEFVRLARGAREAERIAAQIERQGKWLMWAVAGLLVAGMCWTLYGWMGQ